VAGLVVSDEAVSRRFFHGFAPGTPVARSEAPSIVAGEAVTCIAVPDVPIGGESPNPEFPLSSKGEVGRAVPSFGVEGSTQPVPAVSAPASDTASAGAKPASAASSAGSNVRTAGKHRHRAPRTRRRRWTVRTLIVAGVIVALAALLGGGGYFYLNYQFHRIKTVKVHNLMKVGSKPGSPFTVLVVGSDSRAFVNDSSECKSYGCGSATGGQRSDVTILVRVLPAARKIEMLSIPRDTWVTIPGDIANVSGQNRINAAFNNGPSLLVQTIEQNFHIPINYFVDVNFPGLQKMVKAIGGIHLDFKYRVKDLMSGLRVRHTGCQLLDGAQALALVRSRHLQYYADGTWYYDYGSDFTRIRNQQAFFRAVIRQLHGKLTDLFAMNSFISAATQDLMIDQTLGERTILKLAEEFHSFSPGSLKTETLPTEGPYTTSGGADVLLPAPRSDAAMVKSFLAYGTASKVSTTTTTQKATTTSSSTTTTSAATTTTTPANKTTVTTVVTPPSGAAMYYNKTSAPYDPTPC